MKNGDKSLMTAERLSQVRIPAGSRKILVKILHKTTDERTPSGIIKIAETDVDWNLASHSNRFGVVVATPRGKLPFKVKGDLMPWETQIEVGKGMTVWFDFMASENCVTYIDEEGFDYKLMDYDNLYVATWPTEGSNGSLDSLSLDETEHIRPLNGFHLFERLHHESRSKYDLFGPMRINRTIGRVKYVAKNNTAYENGVEQDHVELQVGDKVQFGVVPEVTLEDEAHCHFDGGTMYRRAQARNIDMVWRDDELILPKGRLLLKQVKDELITRAGIILQKPDVKQHTGTVLVSSVEGVSVGDEINYVKGGGRPTKYKDEDCRVLIEDSILYVKQ